ncbi:MAG: hypothetical protein IJZ96_12070 [Lachnospiraceae bacterium]|nr:hypothetical protein [Lachnospiraceae bacterium]MBQ8319187.1 hypothetical protein [Lachnospiraceae bacterium]
MKKEILNYATNDVAKTMDQLLTRNGKYICILYGIWAAHDLIDKAIKTGVPARVKVDEDGAVEFSVNDNTFVVE